MSKFIELIEHLADLFIVRDHTIAVVILSALSAVLGCEVSSEVTSS